MSSLMYAGEAVLITDSEKCLQMVVNDNRVVYEGEKLKVNKAEGDYTDVYTN